MIISTLYTDIYPTLYYISFMKVGNAIVTKKRSGKKKGGATGEDISVAQGSGLSVDNLNWRLIGSSGNTSLEISLNNNQNVIVDGGSMVYMNADIKVETRLRQGSSGLLGSLGFAVGRTLSGESLFLNHYTGTNEAKAQKLVLGIPLPGDFVMLDIQPGTGWKMSRGAFVAASNTLLIGGKTNFVGFVGVGQDEGGFLTYVVSKTDPGSVWMAAYGTIEKHELQEGEKMLVNNEHFLACPAETSYKLVRVGKSFKSLLFSGEGFAMKFTGPCTMYTQSKGVLRLVKELAPYIERRT
jgi:uncharacterized protein (TIGR00266 family)